jgi:Ca2+-binding EF-hand superfamily protein
MFIEEKIIQENLLTREHIDEIYHLFVNLCDDERFKIIPLNFINIFDNISTKKGLSLDKEIWNQIFFEIDHDKDGAISFQDFLRFIYNYLKLIFGEICEKSSYNRLM